MKDIRKDILVRVSLVYLGLLLFAGLILTRAVYIQSFEDPKLLEMSRNQELQVFTVDAVRGNICADDGTLLAVSVPIFEIRMDLAADSITDAIFRQGVDSLAISLASLFKDRSSGEYRDLLWEGRRNKERFVLIKRGVTYPELNRLRTFPILRRGRFKGGLIAIPKYRRELPFKTLARRTIGYESGEGQKKVFVGLEGSFSEALQGVGGQRMMRRVGQGAWMPVDDGSQVEPQNGHDVITTLNVRIQDIAETALRRELIADSADHGCVMVMEVATGHVKAIANFGRTSKGTYEEVFNYAVGESSEPGSTFKLASFLVAYDDGKVEPSTPVATGQGITFYAGRKMEDSHKGGYGTISAQEVFEMSSNVGTSRIIYDAYHTNPQQYIDGLYRLGIQRKLNLQIGGEGNPYIKTTKSKYWSALSLPWMSIGYEVALAPVHILTLYNAVANNGVMVKPLFVKEIRKNGQTVETIPTEVLNPQIASRATLVRVQQMLEGVVEHGTATNIKNPVYAIAGKTGTAQLAHNNRGYQQNTRQVRYKGSFVGYFPSRAPRYSIIVVIVNPKKGKYYGGAIAAPVFREIADKIYASQPDICNPLSRDTMMALIPSAHIGRMQDTEQVLTALGIRTSQPGTATPWVRPAGGDDRVALTPLAISRYTMPDVRGMGLKDAIFLLEQLGLRVIVSGKGTVTAQSVPPGKMIQKGSTVMITLQIKSIQTASL